MQLEVVVDVKILPVDLAEVEHLSVLLEEKDNTLLLNLTKEKDHAKKEWLKNWINLEVDELMRRDRDDVRNNIELYSDDLQKLNRIVEKF